MVRPRTEIWKHFREEKVTEGGVDKTYAKCNIGGCGHLSKINDGSTSVMRKHMVSQHPVEWNALEQEKAEKKRQGDQTYEELEQVR